MPRSVAYIEEEWDAGHKHLIKVDPKTGERSRFATDVPNGGYTISPTEDYLIITADEEGPKEDNQVYEVLEMSDRQSGWRRRTYLMRYDIATDLSQRITFGNKGEYLYDISPDGKKLLIGSSHSRLTKRPTTVHDIYIMDAKTLAVDTLITAGEFFDHAGFSPDGKQLLFRGNPEAFNRIGCQLPADVTPSSAEYELFLFDIATKKVTPLTKDFDPSVNNFDWSLADGQIYFSAEDRDYVSIFRLNPSKATIEKLPLEGDDIYRFDLSTHSPTMAWLGYKTMEQASAYVVSLQNLKKARCLFDGKTTLGKAELGTCQDWNYVNSKGETVYGRLYLPKDFDATKKYPMIVYYYGVCSPTSRSF
jgi:dipeptidyl aminopeptidase/acylaminoacyl peptidase